MATSKRRANGEGSVIKLPNGQWRARMMLNHKAIERTGKTKREALQKLNEVVEKKAMGYVDGKIPTLEEYGDYWLESVKKPALKDTSYDRLESTFFTHIYPRLGAYRVEELTAQIIQTELINPMRNEGYGHSSIKKAYDGVRALCRYAYLDGKIMRNPADLVVMPNKSTFEQKGIVFFNAAERQAIINSCKSTYGNGTRRFSLGSAYILAMYTGLRMSEVLGLKWKHVDLERKRIIVEDIIVMVKNRDPITPFSHKHYLVKDQSSTKTDTRREVPLCRQAMDALLDLKKVSPNVPEGYVVSRTLGIPVTPGNFDKTFRKILDRAGVKNAGIHALRHTCATMLFERGVDVRIISEILGHSSTAVTYNTYVHVIDSMKSKALDLIDDIE